MPNIKVKVTAQALFSPEQVRLAALEAVQDVMDAKVADHFVKVAKERAPAGKEEPGGTNKRSFKKLAVREASEFPFRSPEFERATSLQFKPSGKPLSGTERAKFFVQAFGKRTSDKNVTKFFRYSGRRKDLKGQSPSEVVFKNNTLKGVFKGVRTPGRLRDSIHYEGSKIVGHSVVALFAADAPHASAIHDGFTHHGGPNHSGKTTQVPPQPFFEHAVANITDDFDRLQG